MTEAKSKESTTEYGYWAFISYSHQDNLPVRGDGGGDHIQWANWIHEQLETFCIPEGYRDRTTRTGEPMPGRFFPTFRDEAELPTSHDLAGQIRDALERSRFLIVIASPRSARSRYVNEEVRHFRSLGRGDRILTLIVDGEPNVRLHPKAGWREDDDCFCPALVHPLTDGGEIDTSRLLLQESIAADVRVKDSSSAREMRASERGQPDRRALLDFMKLKLVGGLMGVGLDTLVQRDKVRQLDEARRRARILHRWLAAVTVLTLLAVAGGAVAWQQRKIARANETRAGVNAAEARANAEMARTNAAEAEANARRAEVNLAHADFREGIHRLEAPETSGEAVALLARAARSVGLPAALSRLWTLFQQRQFWAAVPPSKAALPADSAEGRAPVPEAFATVVFENVRRKPDWFSLSADGRTCVTIVNGDIVEGTIDKHRFRVWKIDGTPVTPWLEVGYSGMHYVSNLSSAHLSENGALVAVVANPWREPQYVEIWDTAAGERIGDAIEATGSVPQYQNVSFSKVRFLVEPGNEKAGSAAALLLASLRGDAALYDVDAASEMLSLRALARHASPVILAEVAGPARWLVSVSEDRRVMVTDTVGGDPVGHPFIVDQAVKAIGCPEPGRLRVITADDAMLDFLLTPRVSVPLPAAGTSTGLADETLPIADEGPNAIPLPSPGATLARSADGLRTLRLAGRNEVAMFVGAPDGGEKSAWSRRFPFAVYRASFAAAADRLVVQSDSFATEVWNAETNQRVGYPVDEARLFLGSERPSKPLLASVDASGGRLLTRSFFWNPPNVGIYWFTAWDLASASPLVDPIVVADDGSGESVGTHAEFSADGKLLVIGAIDGKALSPTRAIAMDPPSGLVDGLADAAEALGGLAARDDGTFAPVGDRMETLEAFLSRWEQ